MTVINIPLKQNGPLFGIRHLQVVLLFLCVTAAYLGRINASVAVVAITNANTTNPDFEEYDWNEQEKSFILSSFFWGYVITQFPGGYLSKKYGSKLLLLLATMGSSVLSLITPVCISFGGWEAFCGIRMAQGIFQGVIFPCIHCHVAQWAPIEERNRLGAFSHSGIEFGTVLAFAVSGLIAASSAGWPGIFYISGGAGVLWSILWICFGASTLDDSKSISLEEKKYIESSRQQTNSSVVPTPWKKIFTSVPFLTLLITRCAQAWGFSTLLAEIPTYMNSILKMDIKSNAIFSALPYFVTWILAYIFLFLADVLAKGQCASLTLIRKGFNSLAFWIPALALIGLGYVTEENTPIAIALLTIAVGINGANVIGSTLNTIDLSPNHAGILMGIVNTLANVIAIITPLVVGVIVTDKHDQSQWRTVFFISATIFLVGNLIYIIFGRMDKQSWSDPADRKLSVRRESIFVESSPHVIA